MAWERQQSAEVQSVMKLEVDWFGQWESVAVPASAAEASACSVAAVEAAVAEVASSLPQLWTRFQSRQSVLQSPRS